MVGAAGQMKGAQRADEARRKEDDELGLLKKSVFGGGKEVGFGVLLGRRVSALGQTGSALRERQQHHAPQTLLARCCCSSLAAGLVAPCGTARCCSWLPALLLSGRAGHALAGPGACAPCHHGAREPKRLL